jgi:hypothetical protein
MPDKPKDPPTYEEVQRELGPDLMSFMSGMVRPDQHEEREDEANPSTERAGLTPEEQNLIQLLECLAVANLRRRK